MKLTRRTFLKLSALSVTAAATGMQGPRERPNVVIVFPDQMRAHTLGFLKQDPAYTPNLDAFAQESCVFTEAISGYPVCSPFRAIFMSGAWPMVNRVFTNCTASDKHQSSELPTTLTCWSDVLSQAGYDQFYVGKWHLDTPYKPWIPTSNNRGPTKWNEWTPPNRRHGFNRWYAYGTYDQHLRPMYWTTDAKRDDFKFVDQWGPEHEVERAIRFIKEERDKSKPFTLVMSMNPPHPGYELIPKRYLPRYTAMPIEKFLTRTNIPPADTPAGKTFRHCIRYYLAAVTGVDEQFGRILQTLREEGLEENTIVMFFSDHGVNLGAHGLEGKNNPYDESLRIPMLIRWKNHIAPRRTTGLIEAADIAPTLLGLTGYGTLQPSTMQGRNLAHELLNPETQPLDTPQLYMHFGSVHFSDKLTTEGSPWRKLDTTLPDNCYGRRGLRTQRYTYVIGYKRSGDTLLEYLFDRNIDPDELKNHVNDSPETQDIVKTFRATLEQRLAAIGDPFSQVLAAAKQA